MLKLSAVIARIVRTTRSSIVDRDVESLYIWYMLDFLTDNAIELILGAMAFLKIIVNLTPTEKDNQIFGLLDKVINAIIPDRRKAE